MVFLLHLHLPHIHIHHPHLSLLHPPHLTLNNWEFIYFNYYNYCNSISRTIWNPSLHIQHHKKMYLNLIILKLLLLWFINFLYS